MNPIISTFLDSLNVEVLPLEADFSVGEYLEGEDVVKVSTYYVQDVLGGDYFKDVQEIPLDKFSEVYSSLTGMKVSSGTDRRGLFSLESHRKIKNLRVFLPQGKVQIDFEDESQNWNFLPEIHEFLRGTFKVLQD